ncbi:MAG: FAD-binding oxidoreductase [Armatimonadetes bacterium]|nr:FAD-binding oxidoreductase [Armatimonadota bacterium]
MNRSPDVVIVGAGIVGAACGAELQRRGYRVVIVDQFEPGLGETGSSLGIAGLDDQNGADLDLQQLGVALWHDWLARENWSSTVRSSGSLWLADSSADWMLLQHKAEALRDRRVACEIVPGMLLQKVEPALSDSLYGGVFLPDDLAVRPTALLHQLLTDLPGRSFGPASRAVVLGNGFVQLAGGKRLDCGAVVNAAGAGSASLTPGLTLTEERLTVFPVLGATRFRRMVRSHGLTVRPRQDGFVCASSCPDRDTNLAALRKLVRSLDPADATADGCVVSSTSPDGIPIIGPSPSQNGVWLACGLGSRGLATVWAAARLVADQMEGHQPPIDDLRYRPERLAHLRAAKG